MTTKDALSDTEVMKRLRLRWSKRVPVPARLLNEKCQKKESSQSSPFKLHPTTTPIVVLFLYCGWFVVSSMILVMLLIIDNLHHTPSFHCQPSIFSREREMTKMYVEFRISSTIVDVFENLRMFILYYTYVYY